MDKDIMDLIKKLSLSYEIALAIGGSLDLKEMLDRFLKTVVRKGGAYRGTVWLWHGEALEYVAGVGFCTRGVDYHAAGNALKHRAGVVMESGRPLVKTEHDDDFKEFCAPFTGSEKEVLLVPVEKLALIQLSFTCRGASGKGLAGILAGVAPKLGNAILSCLNHEKLLALERTERHHLETSYHYLVNNLDTGIYMSTIEGRFLDANPAFLKIFGFKDRQELNGLTWPSLYVNPDDRESFVNMITAKGRVKNMELLLRRRDGETLWAQVTAVLRPSGKDGIQYVLGIVEDITERKRGEKQLHYLATHDSLTNIPNRYSLEEALKRAVAKAKRGEKSALLLIDLDNFKLVNDTLGHAAGDELLITLTNILKSNLSEGDLLARFGGDEFAVLLEGATAETAGTVAEKLRRVVEESELCLTIHKTCFNLSISIGVIMIDGTLDHQKILSFADTALYAAKDGGRNRVVFARPGEDTAARLSETNELIGLIKNALKENRFVLFFQPVVKIGEGKITHHEALVRLQGEEGEMIPPDRFIPVAERFGLMPQIDRWVVQSSFNALHKYPELELFVNLSGVSLGDEALLEFIEDNIRRSGIDPSRIGFEITETAAVKDLVRAGRWIHRLKSAGCRFALDDFGAGFSSFSYLRTLQVDYLKIDGAFVHNVDKDPANRALVQAMNTVAHVLGKKTIAEFVENKNILKVLQEIGIDCGQGYYLGKPAPFPEGLSTFSGKSTGRHKNYQSAG